MNKLKRYLAIFLVMVFAIPAFVLPFHIISHHGSFKNANTDCINSCKEVYSLNVNEVGTSLNNEPHSDHCKLCDFSVSPFLSYLSVNEEQLNLQLEQLKVSFPIFPFIQFSGNNESLRAPPLA